MIRNGIDTREHQQTDHGPSDNGRVRKSGFTGSARFTSCRLCDRVVKPFFSAVNSTSFLHFFDNSREVAKFGAANIRIAKILFKQNSPLLFPERAGQGYSSAGSLRTLERLLSVLGRNGDAVELFCEQVLPAMLNLTGADLHVSFDLVRPRFDL